MLPTVYNNDCANPFVNVTVPIFRESDCRGSLVNPLATGTRVVNILWAIAKHYGQPDKEFLADVDSHY